LRALAFPGAGLGRRRRRGRWRRRASRRCSHRPDARRGAGIFHASSVLGTYLAVAAGLFVACFDRETGWRVGFCWAWCRRCSSCGCASAWRSRRVGARRGRGPPATRRSSSAVSELFTAAGAAPAYLGWRRRWQPLGWHVLGGRTSAARTCCGRRWNRTALGQWRSRPVRNARDVLATTGGALGCCRSPAESAVWAARAFALFHLAASPWCVGGAAAQSVPALLGCCHCLASHAGMHAATPFTFRSCFRRGCAAPGRLLLNVARCVVIPCCCCSPCCNGSWVQIGRCRRRGRCRGRCRLGGLLGGALLLLWCPETRGQPCRNKFVGYVSNVPAWGYVPTCRASRRARWKTYPTKDNPTSLLGCQP